MKTGHSGPSKDTLPRKFPEATVTGISKVNLNHVVGFRPRGYLLIIFCRKHVFLKARGVHLNTWFTFGGTWFTFIHVDGSLTRVTLYNTFPGTH